MAVNKNIACIKLLIDFLTLISFKNFLFRVFQTVSPSEKFQDNWHIDYIINILSKIENAELKRISINLPPRSLKSIILSVAWPAWMLGFNPSKKIIAVSYSQALANKHSLDCRAVINAQWYKRVFPGTKINKGQDTKSKFVTSKCGFRFATSINSTLTGEGADVIIVDDPLTPLQAATVKEREKVNYWFETTLSSRLNDKNSGVIILTMQRLHPNDLAGYLTQKGNWNVIKLPAIAQIDEEYKLGSTTYLRKSGALLHPTREGKDVIELAKLELGSAAFNAQYLQNPISSTYSIIKYGWANKYVKAPSPDPDFTYQSWDCAAKTHELNDYSVCTTWQVVGTNLYLLDVFREKLDYPSLKASATALYNKYSPACVLIEDKMTGHALAQDLRKETSIPVICITPKHDKNTRALSMSSYFESGKIYLPTNAIFSSDYENELFNFPNTVFDDQVDSTSQMVNWYKNRSLIEPRITLL